MIIKINGTPKFFNSIESVKMIRPGRYEVTNFRGVYKVEGGRHSGGTSREWFFEGPAYNGFVRCTSLVEACKIIDNT